MSQQLEESSGDTQRDAGLTDDQVEVLWRLFVAIHTCWGDEQACRVEDMASRWREFIQVKIAGTPSYWKHYVDACDILAELEEEHGSDLYAFLFMEGQVHRSTEKQIVAFKRYVVDEFIRVYVNSGGFRSFGGRNYAGFVSGSRFRTQRPYRTFEDA
ncbi:hypothetical protein [Allorhodopirellula heiligendammensis]|uniref:Uncharacterized protein n=1 Tax=Allorhodopirellula heiligendammensis TaxID=2714739 RepID=A0A5C6BH04_9BACT|nr:hypothetical protein [Allorhodopirellula heiligendammensis]TWU09734.1 hypothetical protein Poly21_55390 [Allorhodopirellula heiligendammensis]